MVGPWSMFGCGGDGLHMVSDVVVIVGKLGSISGETSRGVPGSDGVFIFFILVVFNADP